VETSQLQKMQLQSELEQSRVMEKISSGWKRDSRPQSELIQAITLDEEEEQQARRLERKIRKFTEQQAKLRTELPIKVDHVQLEFLEKEIQLLSNKDVLQKIAAGFRRRALEGDVAKTAAPVKLHSSLVKSKAQPETAPAASQSLEHPTDAGVAVQETKVDVEIVSREIDEVSEVSTVDTVDARQAAALEQAAHALKAAGLTAEQLHAWTNAQTIAF